MSKTSVRRLVKKAAEAAGVRPYVARAGRGDPSDVYGTEVNHGRLYPNLDELVKHDLVEKSERDKRTNEYELTDDGYDLLLGELTWEFSKLVTDEDRAADVTALLE